MDMCNAVKDTKLAKLYTSKQRCMFEFNSCTIYLTNREKIVAGRSGTSLVPQTSDFQPAQGQLASYDVDCEFYSNFICNVLHRRLTGYEAARCSQFSHTCPLRERALRWKEDHYSA
jgi:hypothetical protein